MTTPEHGGFVGFDGFHVTAAPHDFVALDPVDGVERFEAHFRGEGRRQANQIARELLMERLLTNKQPVLVGRVDAASVATPAQHAYADGLSAHLRHNAAVLRGIVALRELGLSASYVTSHEVDLTAASDMPSSLCQALAVTLDSLSSAIAVQATTCPPAGSPPRGLVMVRLEALQ